MASSASEPPSVKYRPPVMARRCASLDFGGVMSAEVRRALFKAEKFASLGGDELAAMMAFIGAATRLVKTVEGVKENGAPPPELQPLRDIVASVVTHAEVAEKIRACVDDQGGFKDGASPELRRARSQRAAAEAKLRRALQSSSGSPPRHERAGLGALAALDEGLAVRTPERRGLHRGPHRPRMNPPHSSSHSCEAGRIP